MVRTKDTYKINKQTYINTSNSVLIPTDKQNIKETSGIILGHYSY
jgi:hypothetical protein